MLERARAELARYGIPLSEIDRDPRPSRVERLLSAAREVDARLRLEDWEDRVNTGGVQGPSIEYENGREKKPDPKHRTVLVGHDARKAELQRRAGLLPPEDKGGAAPAPVQEQRKKAASFWGAVGIAGAVKVRVDGERISVVEHGPTGVRAPVGPAPE